MTDVKLTIPPVPHECREDGSLKGAPQYICELAVWGQDCAAIAQREAALADELAEALDRIRYNQSCADPDCCSQARAHEKALEKAWKVLAKHKEARNG